MSTKIRLKRIGKKRNAIYRVVVIDSRAKRDGRAIEEIGFYNPSLKPSVMEVNSERAQYWLGVGAQPSETVQSILKVTGDWQKFTGDKTKVELKVAEAKETAESKIAKLADEAEKVKATAAKKAAEESKPEPEVKEESTPEEKPTEEAPVEEAPVEEAPVEEAPVEEAPVEETPAEETPAEEVKDGE